MGLFRLSTKRTDYPMTVQKVLIEPHISNRRDHQTQIIDESQGLSPYARLKSR
jgi:hypothetical protein